MSYPNGLSKLHSDDGGSQWMAREEDSVGSHEGQGPPSTASEHVPSRVYSSRVIMCLKLVEESRANAFWKIFFFHPNITVSSMSLDLVLQSVQTRITMK